MPSPDGHRAPSQQKPLADADAPGKHQRVKGETFPQPRPWAGGTRGDCGAAGGACGGGGGSGGLHTSV